MKREATIADAKKLANELGCSKGVIVLAFDETEVSAASYGHTRQKCAELRYLLDRVFEQLTASEESQ